MIYGYLYHDWNSRPFALPRDAEIQFLASMPSMRSYQSASDTPGMLGELVGSGLYRHRTSII